MPVSARKSLIIVLYATLALSTIAVFWQVRNYDFINYDDSDYVYENPHVLNGLTQEGVVWAFTSSRAANWHPLTWLSHQLDCQLFGNSPGKMHLVNLLFHIVNTLLLFAVLKNMTGSLWPSAFVASAFAIHPMHIESVAWISERKDVLSTLFWMLTLAAYAGYVKRRSLFGYLLTILPFALGLMAKPMLVTLPFVLLLLDYWPLNRFEPQTVKTSGRQGRKLTHGPDKRKILYWLIIEKIPFFALAAISSVITFLVQRTGGAMSGLNTIPLQIRVANAFLSYVRYIGKMFWPQNLAIVYPFDADSITFWPIVLCVFTVVTISFLVIRFGRARRYLPVGWFWFLGTLVPVIGFVQVGQQSYADRYTYIPYIGLFIMIAWGLTELLSKWSYRRIALGTSALVALTVLGICTYRQTSYWKNNSTLFSHALEITQNNYVAYSGLGDALRKDGNTSLAIEQYKKAIRIAPDHADALLGLGCALSDQGDFSRASEYFLKTLQLKPNFALAYYNLGVVRQKQGKLDEAVDCLTRAVELSPDLAEAHNNLANIFVLQGRLDEAIGQFHQALRLMPGWFAPMNNLAFLIATHPELKGRDVNEAVRLARRACELTSYRNPLVMGTLAAAYASAGRFTEAIDTAQKAMALADAANEAQIKEAIRFHLSFYTRGEPYTESAPEQPLDINKP
jgi:tetratricopeptide (TPR) repeat protein